MVLRMSVALAQTQLTLADAAMGSEDWAAALNHTLRARGLLLGVADGGKDGLQMRFDRPAIDAQITDLKAKVSSAASATTGESIQRTKVNFAAVTD
jgi:hypothetical protein